MSLKSALNKSLVDRVMGQGFHPLLMGATEFYGHDTVTLLRLLDQPQSWWWQQAGGREATIVRSLQRSGGVAASNAGR